MFLKFVAGYYLVGSLNCKGPEMLPKWTWHRIVPFLFSILWPVKKYFKNNNKIELLIHNGRTMMFSKLILVNKHHLDFSNNAKQAIKE